MNTERHDTREMEDRLALLTDAYLHGEITPEGLTELETLVMSAPEAARLFAGYVQQSGMMREVFENANSGSSVDHSDPEADDFLSILSELDVADERPAAPIDFTAERSRRGRVAKERAWRERRRARQAGALVGERTPRALTKVTVWVGLAALIALAIWIGLPDTPRDASKGTADPRAFSDRAGSQARVAVVRSAVGARWDGEARHILWAGTRVSLAQGLVEVVFDDGASLIVQGPATFEPTGTNSVWLISGRIVANTRDAAPGFTVATQAGVLRDQGGGFGIRAEANGQVLAQAFAGEVWLQPAGGEEVVLAAGQAVSANTSGQVRSVSLDALAFVRDVEYQALANADTDSYARWLAYSYELRRDPAVLVYFAPDRASITQGRLPNLSSNAEADASLEGGLVVAGRFPEKVALGFASEHDICRFTENSPSTALTLAAWVWIDRLDRSPIVALMDTDYWETPGATHWQLEYKDGGRTWGMSINVLERHLGPEPKATSWGILSPADAGRWVHLAVVIDDDASLARFYVDGRLRDTQPFAPNVPVQVGRARIGSLQTDPDRMSEPLDRHLDGRIDEIVILSRPMSDTEIEQMYRAGRPTGDRPVVR